MGTYNNVKAILEHLEQFNDCECCTNDDTDDENCLYSCNDETITMSAPNSILTCFTSCVNINVAFMFIIILSALCLVISKFCSIIATIIILMISIKLDQKYKWG